VGGVIAVMLGVGLAAAQLVPTAELQAQSQRAGGLDESFVLNFSYSPLSLVTLFNPNFFGNPGDGSYVIGGAYFETAAYIGILPVVLAIVGVIHYVRLRRRLRRKLITAEPQGQNHGLIPFFVIVTVVALILALGKYGIYPLLYRYVPTFSALQAPARWLLLAVFSLTMLAALAVPMWKPDRRARRRVRIALIGSVSLIAAGIFAQMLMRNTTPITSQLIQGVTVLGVLVMAVALIFLAQPTNERHYSRWMISVLIFVAADLWWANAQSIPTVPANFYDKRPAASADRVFWTDPKGEQLPQSAFDNYLTLNDYRIAVARWKEYRQSELPDLNLLDRQPLLNNFDPLRPEGFERLTKLLNENANPAILRAAAVGSVISSDKVTYPYQTAPTNTVPLRVMMVGGVIPVHSLEEAELIMRSADWMPEKTVVLEGNISKKDSSDAGSAKIDQEDAQNLSISVQSPQGGWLVVADTYYPGWLATVDGTETPIYRANLAFRAVEIPSGDHTVRMLYRPNSWNLGLTISAAALAIWVLMLAVSLVRRNERNVSGVS
jgi:hypothetical protein